MQYFKPYELKFTTRRSKSDVLKGLSKRAKINGDHFKIPSRIFSFTRGSKVEGEILTKGEFTIVKAKVLASGDLKAFPFLPLALSLITFFTFSLNQIVNGNYNLKTLVIIPGGLLFSIFLYGIAKAAFLFSFQIQKSFLEYFIKYDE